MTFPLMVVYFELNIWCMLISYFFVTFRAKQSCLFGMVLIFLCHTFSLWRFYLRWLEWVSINPFKNNGCTSNQLIGFYMMRPSTINEIKHDINLQKEKGMRIIRFNTICIFRVSWKYMTQNQNISKTPVYRFTVIAFGIKNNRYFITNAKNEYKTFYKEEARKNWRH